jgi:hypothetical protein
MIGLTWIIELHTFQPQAFYGEWVRQKVQFVIPKRIWRACLSSAADAVFCCTFLTTQKLRTHPLTTDKSNCNCIRVDDERLDAIIQMLKKKHPLSFPELVPRLSIQFNSIQFNKTLLILKTRKLRWTAMEIL